MTQMMVLMASQLQSQKLKQQRRRQQLTLLMILVMKPAPEPKAKAKTFWLKHSSTANKFITTAVMKAIGIISSGKVKGTLTSTSQSGLRKPHLLYPSFAVTRMARMISRTKEKHARKLDSRCRIDQLKASFAKLTKIIKELTNA